MARMHSRDKGKSGSKKPADRKPIDWVTYSKKELELMVIKVAKEGHKPSMIGLILRDSYGIPSIKDTLGKSIVQVLRENNMESELPEDLINLIKRAVNLNKHLENNNPDKTAKRGLRLAQSKIGRLVKYYKRSGRLPASWKYDESKFKLMVE